MITSALNTIKAKKKLVIAACLLYSISVAISFYYQQQFAMHHVQKVVSNFLHQQESKAYTLLRDTATLYKLNSNSTDVAKQQFATDEYGLFLFDYADSNNVILNYWNNNKYYFTSDVINRKDGSYFENYQSGEFELIKQNIFLRGQQTLAIIMLPIRWHYFIENKYLKTSFVCNEAYEKKYDIEKPGVGVDIQNSFGQTLFSLQNKQDKKFIGYSWLALATRTTALFMFLFLLQAIAVNINDKLNFTKSYIVFIVGLVLIRMVSYLIPFPFKYTDLPLFDPSIYASNFIHPSLGDLLLNVFLTFWAIGFYKLRHPSPYIKLKWWLNLSILYAACVLSFLLIRSLVVDAKISFDVINFFSLSTYSFVSFLIICLIILCFFHISHVLLQKVHQQKISLSEQYLVVIFCSLIASIIAGFYGNTSSYLIICFWMIMFLTIMQIRQKDMHQAIAKSTFFIGWVAIFTLSVAALIINETKTVELEQRKKWAEKLALQTDPESENLINLAIANFNDSFLVHNFYRLSNELSNKKIKDSLISQNFSGYLNKFETHIYTFDSAYRSLYNDDSNTYIDINSIIVNNASPTAIENLYAFEGVDNQTNYIFKKSIQKNQRVLGYLFVSTKPKKYKSETIYPELFKQTQDISTDFNTNYSYAVYSNGKVLSKYNSYNFPSTVAKVPISTSGQFNIESVNGYSELTYGINDKQVIIVKKDLTILELVTLFAYLFASSLLFIGLIHAINFLFRYRFRKGAFKELFQFNIRTQIHFTIIFISIISFIIIGIASISFFIFRFNQNNQERLTKAIQVIANEIQEKTKVVHSQLQFDDVLNTNNFGFGSNIEATINSIAEIHNTEINLYNIEGTLIATTQPYIFDKHILNNKLNTKAYFELYYNNSNKFIQEESAGKFNYLSIYIPVKDDDGNTYAFLNIPYLNSQAELNQEISSFLATLINLNAIIVLLAGAFAYWLSYRLTVSFQLIGNRMKEINLGKQNEVIEWPKKDEIGSLVNEYNKMVLQLEKSAKALAQNEREGAWREMARQVAHEIKNPLTPMKLSIQYLQRAIDHNQSNVKELSRQVAQTLIQQIDQLSTIAADFSQFANITNAKPEPIHLYQIISDLKQLYASYNNLTITYSVDTKDTTILVDKNHLNRLLTNLIKNSIEAAEDKDLIEIDISQQLTADHAVLLTITDNGHGIPEDMQSKLFTPNFTTKSSGTGLGLAICKGIVEQMNGEIWFATEEEKGTSFYIKIPLPKQPVTIA